MCVPTWAAGRAPPLATLAPLPCPAPWTLLGSLKSRDCQASAAHAPPAPQTCACHWISIGTPSWKHVGPRQNIVLVQKAEQLCERQKRTHTL
jgi:hypothetical protein